jgi:hypothetical protein
MAINGAVVMDEDEEMAELRAQKTKRVRDEAKAGNEHGPHAQPAKQMPL